MRTYAIGVPRRVTRGARDNPWVTPGLGQSTSQPQATGSHSCTGFRAGARARPRLCPRGLHCALTSRPLNSLNVSPPPSLGDRVSSLRAALFAARTSRRLCRSTFQSSNLILFSQIKIPAKFPGKLRAPPGRHHRRCLVGGEATHSEGRSPSLDSVLVTRPSASSGEAAQDRFFFFLGSSLSSSAGKMGRDGDPGTFGDASRAVKHMNDDHIDSLVAWAHYYLNVPAHITDVALVDCTEEGFHLMVEGVW